MPSGPSCGICCRCRGGSRARAAGPEGYCRRQMIDAVRYLVDNGIKWRAMPAT